MSLRKKEKSTPRRILFCGPAYSSTYYCYYYKANKIVLIGLRHKLYYFLPHSTKFILNIPYNLKFRSKGFNGFTYSLGLTPWLIELFPNTSHRPFIIEIVFQGVFIFIFYVIVLKEKNSLNIFKYIFYSLLLFGIDFILYYRQVRILRDTIFNNSTVFYF